MNAYKDKFAIVTGGLATFIKENLQKNNKI